MIRGRTLHIIGLSQCWTIPLNFFVMIVFQLFPEARRVGDRFRYVSRAKRTVTWAFYFPKGFDQEPLSQSQMFLRLET